MNTARFLAPLLVLGVCLPIFPATITLNFEGLSNGEAITSPFHGLTFTNAIALEAGVGLNEFEFPPRSGQMVISDDGGPMTINFASPVQSFSGYFTYLVPLTVSAYDVDGQLLGTTTSVHSNNLACLAGPSCSGDPGSNPNELLSVTGLGIRSVTIAGDTFGSSFTLDDATISTSAVPEPSFAIPLLTAVGILLSRFRGHAARKQ